MNLIIEAKEFIKINDISYILNFDYNLNDYLVNDELINGSIDLNIEYFLNNNQGIMNETKKINFSILNSNNYDIKNLKITNLDLSVLDNQGINVFYKLDLEYDIFEKSNNNKDLEKIKEEIVLDIDEKLENSLIEKNLIQKETKRYDSFFNNTKKVNYKIIFIKEENELEELAKKYQKPINEIYKDNKYNIKDSVIIKL